MSGRDPARLIGRSRHGRPGCHTTGYDRPRHTVRPFASTYSGRPAPCV